MSTADRQAGGLRGRALIIGRIVVGTAGGLLGLLGLVVHPAQVLVGWLLCAVLVGPPAAMYGHGAGSHGAGSHGAAGSLRAGAAATLTASGAVAVLAGLIAVLGAAAGLFVATLLGVWIVVRWCRGNAAPPTARGVGPASAAAPRRDPATAGPPQLMTVAQLCGAWQRSSWVLRQHASADLYAEMVELRVAVLDEVERRDPDGLSRWLGSGPRVDSDLGRFLSPSSDDR